MVNFPIGTLKVVCYVRFIVVAGFTVNKLDRVGLNLHRWNRGLERYIVTEQTF